MENIDLDIESVMLCLRANLEFTNFMEKKLFEITATLPKDPSTNAFWRYNIMRSAANLLSLTIAGVPDESKEEVINTLIEEFKEEVKHYASLKK